MSISTNLTTIRNEIKQAAEQSQRNHNDITLVAVSKFHGKDAALEAIKAGQTVFGENKIQEATHKWTDIKENNSDIELHFIGHLQTNKAKEAVQLFDVIEIVDRKKLALSLAKEMEKQDKYPECYIQVNTGSEPQKSGISPEETDELIALCQEINLPVTGVMCIPPAGENPEPHFDILFQIAERNGLKNISMGMSSDYATAIEHGATHIRVGTAIFGKRPTI